MRFESTTTVPGAMAALLKGARLAQVPKPPKRTPTTIQPNAIVRAQLVGYGGSADRAGGAIRKGKTLFITR